MAISSHRSLPDICLRCLVAEHIAIKHEPHLFRYAISAVNEAEGVAVSDKLRDAQGVTDWAVY